MLKKLFKYDSKYVSRIMLPIYAALIAFTALFCFLLYLQELWESTALFFAGTAFLYFVVLMAAAVAPMILVTVRIFSNLYGDEGYLMHTLPVKPTSHIWSKCWTMILFEAVSFIFVMISFSMIAVSSILMYHVPFSVVWFEIKAFFAVILGALRLIFSSGEMTVLFILGALIVILSPFYAFFLIFSSCSLGQRANKHKILASFGAYFGISFVVSILNQIVSFLFILSSGVAYVEDVNVFNILFVPLLCQATLYLVLTIAGYAFSKHSLARRLNLE